MACCGGKRAKLNQARQEIDIKVRADIIYFQYIGKTAMTVICNDSQTRYRFDNSGAIVAVSARDKHTMTLIPNLRQVKDLQ